ncbi:Acetylornithine deacetylase [Geoglobus ahangari]|uniref:Acetylornithine deacetylase n=1 Tax=Geoglobus ahangari TaxID=113653 RepID=A0A0F7ICM8_9EURY|nr:M20/M25/M40 family metallo-hydrolase [Geoglobus ahangari]AKG91039.1 Acetylornithine deacetylase [Geoglobus ahangari]
MLKILEEITRIDSTSGNEDEIKNYVSDWFEDLGFKTKTDSAGNLIVRGNSDLWFITHLDTVPRISDFRVEGEYAYGTGVADAKGSIAAILLAAEGIEEMNLNFAFLVDEEEGGTGSKHFARNYSGRAVVMEPTEMKLAEKQLGSAEVVLEFRGVSAHGAYWNGGVNAIELAMREILKLKEKYRFSVQEISGGSDLYAIPDSCRVRLSFIFDFGDDYETFREMVESLPAEFEVLEFYEPIECDSIPEIERHVGERTVMLSWTDAYNLKKAGWKVTIWGPGNLEDCHTDRERVRIADIKRCAEIIRRVNEEVVE